jgi:hypothetical protein
MSRDQNAARSHNIKTDDSSFERREELRYLGKTLQYQNYFQKEIKSRLNLGNSVQNIFSSNLLSKNIKNEINRNIILPLLLYGCEIYSLSLREESRLSVFENRVLRRIFGPEQDEVTGRTDNYLMRCLMFYSSDQEE